MTYNYVFFHAWQGVQSCESISRELGHGSDVSRVVKQRRSEHAVESVTKASAASFFVCFFLTTGCFLSARPNDAASMLSRQSRRRHWLLSSACASSGKTRKKKLYIVCLQWPNSAPRFSTSTDFARNSALAPRNVKEGGVAMYVKDG